MTLPESAIRFARELLGPFQPLANRLLICWATGLLLIWLDRFSFYFLSEWLLLLLLTLVLGLARSWVGTARPLGQAPFRAAVSAATLPAWLWMVMAPSWRGWPVLSATLARLGLGIVFDA